MLVRRHVLRRFSLVVSNLCAWVRLSPFQRSLLEIPCCKLQAVEIEEIHVAVSSSFSLHVGFKQQGCHHDPLPHLAK